jgi:hypothetical protein
MMPQRLRRATRKIIDRLKDDKKHVVEALLPSERAPAGPSFLALPPEIRNQIYQSLAAETTLTLATSKQRKPPPIISLLLACHQTRREYMKMLLANAHILISISEYQFGNLVRVLECMPSEYIEALRLNPDLWILLCISRVPSRDDRKNLRGWIDYRRSDHRTPFFGPNGQAAGELEFEYDVRFGTMLRPPRRHSSYVSSYSLKLDLLRSHLRMYRKLEEDLAAQGAEGELRKLRSNIQECVQLFEELQMHCSSPEPPARSASISTGATGST